jgi:hypothetical protein
MENLSNTSNLIFDHAITKISQVQRRIGFSEGYIEIRHALVGKNDDFGLSFDFYEEDTNFGVTLYSLVEKDCHNINLLEVAKRLADETIVFVNINLSHFILNYFHIGGRTGSLGYFAPRGKIT